jgi:hypothetical protein
MALKNRERLQTFIHAGEEIVGEVVEIGCEILYCIWVQKYLDEDRVICRQGDIG